MTMISIGDVLAESDLLEARFTCDFGTCGGQCCIEGELGAPLSDNEADQLTHPPEELLRMLPEKNRRYFRRHGGVEVYQGRAYSRTVGNRECVFTCMEGGITTCAIETAFTNGLSPFPKPLSCRLFPIRVRKKFGLDYLVYERHAMCRAAAERGRELNMLLVDYVSKALEELYGNDWFVALKQFIDSSPMKKCQE
ncbi:MAG: DUF3109 family protein [Chlorobiaceae bacterium]|nr:DUF3109 family protein [Chlorobiaceae bacterium]NTV60533.1 DUF3109 family protein [Chlorobiaceae bacterium]